MRIPFSLSYAALPEKNLFYGSVLAVQSSSQVNPGVHDLGMDGGLLPAFQKSTHFQLPKFAFVPIFMMNFGGNYPF